MKVRTSWYSATMFWKSIWQQTNYRYFGNKLTLFPCIIVIGTWTVITRDFEILLNLHKNTQNKERNSILMSVSSLLSFHMKLNINKVFSYLIQCYLIFLASFVLFRILTLCWMTRWIVLNRTRVHVGWFTLGSVGLAAMMIINILLLKRLVQADFTRRENNSCNNTKNYSEINEKNHASWLVSDL